MKKTIALLLALVLCLSLCACGGGNDTSATNTTEDIEAGKDILGEWFSVKSTTKISLSFNADGTGAHNQKGVETAFTWKYDEELNCYTTTLGAVLSATVENVDGIEQLIISGDNFVRAEHYAEAQEAYLAEQTGQQKRAWIQSEIGEKNLAQFNTSYKLSENIEITFIDWEVGTHKFYEHDKHGLWMTVDVKNLTGESINWTELPIVAGDVRLAFENSMSQGSCLVYEYFNYDDSGNRLTFPPNETTRCYVLAVGDNTCEKFEASINTFGYVLGFVSFTFDGIEYYLDFADIQIAE